MFRLLMDGGIMLSMFKYNIFDFRLAIKILLGRLVGDSQRMSTLTIITSEEYCGGSDTIYGWPL